MLYLNELQPLWSYPLYVAPIFLLLQILQGDNQAHQNISVEQWLSNIYNASFVVTDSFHGAVFCILFNVPFVVKLNSVRGNTRLESLLSDFDLTDCICQDAKDITIPNFDWEKINVHLFERQYESREFLIKSLA